MPESATRLHDLDALRAFAMLLGVFWHAGLTVYGISEGWPTDSALLARAGDLFLHTSHAFRMPLFFVLAGFFAALLAGRADVRAFVRARIERIGLPLVVAYLTAIPLTQLALALAQRMAGDAGVPLDVGVLVPASLGLAWFLWYLLLFYATALTVRRVLPAAARAWSGRAFARLIGSPGRVPLLAAVTAVLLWVMPGWSAQSPSLWRPDPVLFAYYGLFFLAGWLLWGRPEALGAMTRRPLAHLVGLTVAAVVAVVAIQHLGEPGARRWELLVTVADAVLCWCAIFAGFAVFRRVFARPRPRVRYLADSAYWLYLAHGPIVVVLAAALLVAGVPFLLVIVVSGVATCVALLVVYDAVIRYGAVGRVLHGRRERAEPAPPLASAMARPQI